MDVAIIGASGSCGRQVAAQLLERSLLPTGSTVHLIGHRGGSHEDELWGLRADLSDAFADRIHRIDIGTDVGQTGASLVVMMAGETMSTGKVDRDALAARNRRIFADSAAGVGRMQQPATVIVQSNPVELAVHEFCSVVDRHRVIGAGAWSDSLRFRREIARELNISRPMVSAQMWGQHGDHLVPIWSRIHCRGVSQQQVDDMIGKARNGRALSDFADEIVELRTRVVKLIEDSRVEEAFILVEAQPPDLRVAVKPFFTHFTAGGHTTELATAHAVVDLIEFFAQGQEMVVPAQVRLETESPDLRGIVGVPVVLDQMEWSADITLTVAKDEMDALQEAGSAIQQLIA